MQKYDKKSEKKIFLGQKMTNYFLSPKVINEPKSTFFSLIFHEKDTKSWENDEKNIIFRKKKVGCKTIKKK